MYFVAVNVKSRRTLRFIVTHVNGHTHTDFLLFMITIMFKPSSEQLAIYERLAASDGGNIMVSACPGSGKTTTIMHAFEYCKGREAALLPPSITYLVFNKRNADEAKGKVPRGVSVSTFHSLGLRALKSAGLVLHNVKIDSRKVPRLIWNALDRDDPDIQPCIKLVSLLKTLNNGGEADDETLQALARQYEVDFANEHRAFEVVRETLKRSNVDLSTLDFDDMLYLAVLLNAVFEPQDYVFVDEAQDTNEVQGEILARLNKRLPPDYEQAYHDRGCEDLLEKYKTRYVLVGDPHQAIYGFRGASSDAMTKLATRFACTTLLLSISYRCPQNVVLEAQRVLQTSL